MAGTPEGKVKDMIRKHLLARGFIQVATGVVTGPRFFWMPFQGPYSVHGVADFILCDHGLFGAIEAKAKDGDQTEHQKDFEKLVNNSGGEYAVVRNERDLLAFLDCYMQGA